MHCRPRYWLLFLRPGVECEVARFDPDDLLVIHHKKDPVLRSVKKEEGILHSFSWLFSPVTLDAYGYYMFSILQHVLVLDLSHQPGCFPFLQKYNLKSFSAPDHCFSLRVCAFFHRFSVRIICRICDISIRSQRNLRPLFRSSGCLHILTQVINSLPDH